MNPQTFLFCAAIVCAAIMYQKHRKAEAEQPQDYDAADLREAIKALDRLSAQLENADRMIQDLDACSPCELLRGFRAQWCGIDGRQHSMDFLADGANRTTAGLKAAALDERERLNSEIIETVRAMQAALDAGSAPALQLDAVDETMDETTDEAAAGEW